VAERRQIDPAPRTDRQLDSQLHALAICKAAASTAELRARQIGPLLASAVTELTSYGPVSDVIRTALEVATCAMSVVYHGTTDNGAEVILSE
jgi:hypothetical protein